MIDLIVCVQYNLDPQLIGGMDRYCWEFDVKLKNEGIIPVWFFPKANNINHYTAKGLKVVLIDHPDFLQGVHQYLIKEQLVPRVMLTHFTRYFTKEMKWFKQLGVSKIVSFEHLYKDLNNRKLIDKVKFAIKGLLYYKYCDKVAFVSEYVHRQCYKEFWSVPDLNKRTEVVFNGIDTRLYKPNGNAKPNDKLKLVCACRIVRAKGIQYLIDAVELLNKDGLSAKFEIDIYGEGSDKEFFKMQIIERNIDNINFLNNVNNLYELLPAYDIAIFPTLGEAMPFFVLESFACGLPVIASNVGGVPELLDESRGWLIETAKVKEIYNAISICLNNNSKYLLMSNNCVEFVENNYTLQHMIERHFDFLKRNDL